LRTFIGLPPLWSSAKRFSASTRSGSFFQGRTAATPAADALGGESHQGTGQFPSAAPDGFHIQPGDARQLAISAMSSLEGFEGDIPAAMILVQAAQQEIHQAMNFLGRMICPG
jgi:hypothetical protein